ncbi:MAG TPA: flagellar biosynthesis protein FliP [Gammaproteobacteria bacterium]|nr:flagellar biosynthesis protein FliP [Gammaproteobacteria bacterium]
MRRLCLFLALLMLLPEAASAEAGLKAISVTTAENGEQTYSISIQTLFLMTALTFLPAAMMMMTSFTRIIIVLAILRQAIGLMQAPSSQILIGLALFLTFFIMAPVFSKINSLALQPYLDEQMSLQDAAVKAGEPLRAFMFNQTRDGDIKMFGEMAGHDGFDSKADVPFTVLVPAFVTSELKTAFQIGFLLFIPFLIIDLVVASVLMSMGMMMLSPMIISLPFKVMLFVMVDGWNIVMGTLASSFYV